MCEGGVGLGLTWGEYSASEVELVWPREEIEIPLIALHVSALVALQDAEEQYVVFLTLTYCIICDEIYMPCTVQVKKAFFL